MTSLLPNINIPVIQSQAAKWAKECDEIRKITLHCAYPEYAEDGQVPQYAIFIWVAQHVNTDLLPWIEQLKSDHGKIVTRAKEDYRDLGGKLDVEKVASHPLYKLWRLIWKLQDPVHRGYFKKFYRGGFLSAEDLQSREFRFHWLVMLVNEGDEAAFEQGGIWEEWNNDEFGSVQLFSREPKVSGRNSAERSISLKDPEGIAQDTDKWEALLRSIEFSIVSDEEIKVRGGGKKAKVYTMKELGFKKPTSQMSNTFIKILRSKDHRYHVGVAHGAGKQRNRAYDVNQKRLSNINERLTAFFKQTYGWDLPQDFKVFELMKGERSGTYGFKFKICREVNVDEAGLNSLPKDNLLELIEKLSLEKGNLSTRGDESSETNRSKIVPSEKVNLTFAIFSF